MHFDNDDSKLTAYALGELTGEEARDMEARFATDDAARHEVNAIRALAGQLTDELAKEPLPASNPAPRTVTRRWPARLAIAAAASIVVGGIAASVLTPSLNRAREVAHSRPDIGSATLSYSNDHKGANNGYKSNQSHTPKEAEQSRVAELQATVADLTNRLDVTERERRNLSEQMAQVSVAGIASAAGPVPAQVTPSSNAESSQISPGQAAMPADGWQKVLEYRREQYRSKRGTDKDGQNILYGDGNVEFQQNPFVDAQRDHIFRARRPGMPERAKDADDSVLLPMNEFDQDGAGPPARNVGPMNTEAYERLVDNAFLDVVANPLSTFSIDVDTASYSNVRRFLTQGQLPPKDAVRIEEMVNYFPYEYAAPTPQGEHPFNADVEVTQCPWKPEHRLVRVALKGMEIAKDQRPPSNLVFLIDVSGSMGPANKLPLLKESMKLLVHELDPTDRVAMVVYAGSSGLVLPSTPAGQNDAILAALDRLQSGGSTNGAQGIELAYSTAVSNFIKDGVNRVILCTDGDFNVGVTNQGDLTRMIEEKAKTGVFLSVLGFGLGNVKDSTMEKLADKGNGNYAYIDTLSEGKKVLVDQMSSTLVTIAKDVKIQIEFNPAVAGAYRLIGYENRMLAKEDFNDDKKDAGEIGAGHTVTALYEVVPAGKPIALPGTDPLKYQAATSNPAEGQSKELMTIKLRYKAPDGDVSKLMEVPATDAGKSFAQASSDLKFASGVAAFGMILRDSPHKGAATFGAVLEWAQEGIGRDEAGYRKEFIELVKKAKALCQ